MGTLDANFKPEDIGGVLVSLLHVGGYLAIGRGSELIEPQDLIKAIYIVDLEHVAKFWDDWEGFEELVSTQPLGIGSRGGYVNRIDSLIHVQLAMRERESGLHRLGRLSISVQRILVAARKLAAERSDGPSTPSSRDLLFSACSEDPELSSALQGSGLQLDRLAEAVKKPPRGRPGRAL
jgi:hypothetical protein